MSNVEGWVSRLRAVLDYDPETGLFTWKPRALSEFTDTPRLTASTRQAMWNGRYAGQPALTARDSYGYLKGTVDSVEIKAHRAAWAIHYGELPGELDHIDRDPGNNRIKNLRPACRQENVRNSVHSQGVIPFRGVQRHKDGRFTAKIRFDGKQKHLGSFKAGEAAAAAYDIAAREAHGDFATLNFPDLSLQQLREMIENLPAPVREREDA